MLLPYTVNYSDNTDKPPFQIQPGQIDTTTTALSLPGKGRIDYGELYNENLVHLLENFSMPSWPAEKPKTRGQLWYDSLNKLLKVYDPDIAANDGWMILVATGVVDRFHVPVVATLPTSNLLAGDLAFLSADNFLYVHDGVEWRPIATQTWLQNELAIDGGTAIFE